MRYLSLRGGHVHPRWEGADEAEGAYEPDGMLPRELEGAVLVHVLDEAPVALEGVQLVVPYLGEQLAHLNKVGALLLLYPSLQVRESLVWLAPVCRLLRGLQHAERTSCDWGRRCSCCCWVVGGVGAGFVWAGGVLAVGQVHACTRTP